MVMGGSAGDLRQSLRLAALPNRRGLTDADALFVSVGRSPPRSRQQGFLQYQRRLRI